jgi:uncharacterized paraquat-inducible protein A
MPICPEVVINCPECDLLISVPGGLAMEPGVCPRFTARVQRLQQDDDQERTDA